MRLHDVTSQKQQIKFLALLISLLDGKCVIGFVTHLLTPDVDLRLAGNQRSGSDSE
jgi:hypothetical protein